MKFFEKIFSPEEEHGIKSLHKDFKVTHDKFWYFNREEEALKIWAEKFPQTISASGGALCKRGRVDYFLE